MIPSTAFISNPLHLTKCPLPHSQNHFLQLVLLSHQRTCYCKSIITECRFPWGNGKVTQGIYLLAKLCFPLELLCVHRSVSSDESQHFPAGKDLEDNLDNLPVNRQRKKGPERQTHSRLQRQLSYNLRHMDGLHCCFLSTPNLFSFL